jgi:cytoskeletal protein CcmA (bactofilin family)
VTFSGSLAAADKIIIHGTGEGDVAAHELLVSGNGTIRGHVRVERADIHGKVLEKIEARECLLLRRSGRIEGTAVYGEIEIEKGGVLAGRASERSTGEKERFKFPFVSVAEIRSGIDTSRDETKAVSF